MVGRLLLTAATLLASLSMVQSQEAQPKHHHHPKAAPAAEKTAAPQDEQPLPEKVQKWFGNTVDGILSGADDALGGDKKR